MGNNFVVAGFHCKDVQGYGVALYIFTTKLFMLIPEST